MARAVQFRSRDQVETAFENMSVETWAIFTGTELFTTGEGKDQLCSALDLLESGADNIIYTLRVYRGMKAEQVNSKTPNNGGCNFYLNGENMSMTNGQFQRQYGANNELISVVNGLKKTVDEMQSEQSQPSKLGMLGEVLDHPVLGAVLERIAMKFIDNMIPGPAAPGQQPEAIPMRAVGNIASDQELVQALEKLKTYDPQLTTHLKKLAILAELDNATFNIILSSLDKMTVD
jgi:hypothetical protein